jgi:glycerol-3-phosphate O-acyltransferase 1/2
MLPTHRSHLDYILVTWIMYNTDIRAPHVAAGDNLIIPIFGPLMRGLGGYFIRRKIDKYGKKDHIYRAVLHTVSTTL